MTDGIFRRMLGKHGRCTDDGAVREHRGGPEGLVLAESAKKKKKKVRKKGRKTRTWGRARA